MVVLQMGNESDKAGDKKLQPIHQDSLFWIYRIEAKQEKITLLHIELFEPCQLWNSHGLFIWLEMRIFAPSDPKSVLHYKSSIAFRVDRGFFIEIAEVLQ